MKICTHCNIEVGTSLKKCPLCQSHLQGDEGYDYWPISKRLKKQSLFMKIVMFLVLTASVICSAIDFLAMEGPHFHWSIIPIVWSISTVALLFHFMRQYRNVPRMLFVIMLSISALIIITGWVCGFRQVSIDYVMPILCSTTLVLNFIFSFIDAGFTENSLIYMLMNIGVGVVPYVFLLIHRGHAPIAWLVTLLISVITFLGLVIFKGRTVLTEFHKRFHI